MRLVDGDVQVSATDLSNFLGCRHLTRLDGAALAGVIDDPHIKDVGFEQLVARGDDHERRVLEAYRAKGWRVVEVGDRTSDGALSETMAALERGADLIYQGTLRVGNRLGVPDFLVRTDLLRTAASDRHAPYEIVDAKLARSAKARAVLQMTFYSQLLTELLGRPPEYMHLALGGAGDLASFRVAEYAAYGRQVDSMLGDFLHKGSDEFPPTDTYPEPNEHCAICRWRVECLRRRRDDDDLSLVANITQRQRKGLKAVGIATLEGLAVADPLPEVPKLGYASLLAEQDQARLQLQERRTGEHVWTLLEPERDQEGGLVADRGLLALPDPSPGDLFFDIEGARYYSEDGMEFGLQYLFGVVDSADIDDAGRPRYHQFWAFDRGEEKHAFEQLIDFFEERLRAKPDLHIYHYNHYEPTAMDHLADLHETRELIVGRLTGRFATREDEADDLLRRQIFVDLYRVVRQGLRASVESYSIKRLEPLCGYERVVPLPDVNERMVIFEADLEAGTARSDAGAQALIAGYNEDDCRATLSLRDWLEERRAQLESTLREPLPRPAPGSPDPDAGNDPETVRLREALLRGLPEEAGAWTPEDRARELMSNLLEWHRRDDKPKWWRWFHLLQLDDDELIRERDALSGLTYGDVVGQEKQSLIHRFTFPPQEHPFADGSVGHDRDGGSWTIWRLDERHGTVDLKVGKRNTRPFPSVLIEHSVVNTPEQQARLHELAQRVVDVGVDAWPREAALDLLLLRRPNVSGDGPIRRDEEDVADAGIRLATELDHSVLPIQGPPGSGKTYLGARQILALLADGKKVGVTAVSHKVIANLLDRTLELAAEGGRPIRVGQRANDESEACPGTTILRKNSSAADALANDELDVVGGTTWLWAAAALKDSVDVLLVDEAGQMSLASTLAAASACRSLILLGDPLQLAQPSQGSHPPGAGVSALEHVLGEATTMPDDRGLFVDRTRRLHPDICRYTSEVFYDERLEPVDGLELQAVLPGGAFEGAGLRMVLVEHTGNANSSEEEAVAIAQLATGFLGGRWIDAEGTERELGSRQLLIVTRSTLRSGRSTGGWRARVSTVWPWERSTASRDRRLRSPSTRWLRRRSTTPRAVWASCWIPIG